MVETLGIGRKLPGAASRVQRLSSSGHDWPSPMPARRSADPAKWTPENAHDWALMRKAIEEIDIALLSFRDFEMANDALLSGRSGNPRETEVRLWAAAQGFLLSTAMVAELFRLPPMTREGRDHSSRLISVARARRFARSFGVGRTNPIHVHKLRNAFVHFFERYEALLRSEGGVAGSDRNRVSLRPAQSPDDRLMLRTVDPYSLRIHYLDIVVDSKLVKKTLVGLRSSLVDRVPTTKRDGRLRRRLEREAREFREQIGDPELITMPESWVNSEAPAGTAKSARELLAEFGRLYNRLPTTKAAGELGMLFDVQGELSFQEGRRRIFDGRSEIIRALERHPHVKPLWFGPVLMESPTRLIATYGRHPAPQGEEGLIRLTAEDGYISQLILRRIPGKLGVATRAERSGGIEQGRRRRIRHIFLA